MSKDSGYIILVARENDEVAGTAMGIMCMDPGERMPAIYGDWKCSGEK